MKNDNTNSHDETKIREAIAELQRAVCAKNVDAILSHYSADAVVFNVKPPYQIRGMAQWRDVWEKSLAHFPASFGTETRDVAITASGELAFARYLLSFTGLPGSQTWIRVTTVYKRSEGKWLIVHEHNSVPFDPETLKVVFEVEP